LASHQKGRGARREGKEAFISFSEMKGEFKKCTLEAETKSQNVARYFLKLNTSQTF